LETKFGLTFATTYDALLFDRHRTAARARRATPRAPI
jgi:hypothetical protein